MLQGNLRVALGTAVLVGTMIGGKAHADGTCTSLMTTVANQLNQHGGVYPFDLVIHRTDVTLTEYSVGTLHATGGPAWPATGNANQLFSDRKNGSQPFNINAADSLTVFLGATGSLFINYNTWGFSTTWDMSCSGSTLLLDVPGEGVVSLTLRAWHL